MDKTLNDRLVRSMLLELNVGTGYERDILEFLVEKGFKVHSKQGANHIFVRTA
jgi:Holliday junction resolvase